jgi:hypothetical protein
MRATSRFEADTQQTQDPCTMTLFNTRTDDHLLRRVRGEYREMPGMRLTVDQAMRLWMLDRITCTGLFDSLVAARFLQQDAHGRYRTNDGGY